MNACISQLLRARWFYPVAATLFTFVFWWSGLTKLLDFPAAVGEMEHFGLTPGPLFAAATIFVQLVGPALIMTCSRWAWLGAGAMAVFTLATIPIAHRFWEMEGIVAFLEKVLVQEHLSMIGGLAIVSALAAMRRQQMGKD